MRLLLVTPRHAGGVYAGTSLRKFHPSAQACEDMRKPRHGLAAANRIVLLRTGRIQADGRQECRLKVLFQKRRGMRKLMSSRMCPALEQVDALEVEIAALGEVEEHGIEKRLSLLLTSTRIRARMSPRS